MEQLLREINTHIPSDRQPLEKKGKQALARPVRINHSPARKRLVVCMHFGSVDVFDQPAISVSQVAKIMRMPYQSVYKIIRDFKDGNYDLSVFR